MDKKLAILLLSLLLGVGGTSTAVSGDYMSGGDVKALLTGKTADGEHHKKGFSYTIFFDPSGAVTQIRGGETRTGNWRVDDEGRHCVKWDGAKKEKCFPFKDNGDGSISKYKQKNYTDDVKILTLNNIREGNQL